MAFNLTLSFKFVKVKLKKKTGKIQKKLLKLFKQGTFLVFIFGVLKKAHDERYKHT